MRSLSHIYIIIINFIIINIIIITIILKSLDFIFFHQNLKGVTGYVR